MKRLGSTLRFYDFSILYSLVILSYVFVVYFSNSSFLIGQANHSDQHHFMISQRLFPQTTPVEERIIPSHVSTTHVVIRSEHEGTFLLDLYQGLLCHIFSEYSFYSQTQAFLLQKTDLIFPFHYFW